MGEHMERTERCVTIELPEDVARRWAGHATLVTGEDQWAVSNACRAWVDANPQPADPHDLRGGEQSTQPPADPPTTCMICGALMDDANLHGEWHSDVRWTTGRLGEQP